MNDNNYIDHRIKLWDLFKKNIATPNNKQKKVVNIQVIFEENKLNEMIKCDNILTPLEIAKKFIIGNTNNIIGSKINGDFFDIWRPINEYSNDINTLELFTFSSNDGKHVFWHSSAHILGEALEKKFGCQLCFGPPLENDIGFYYEFKFLNKSISEKDFPELEKIMSNIIKKKHKFQRLNISKEDALEMFKHNPYKLHVIKTKIQDGSNCSIYRSGDFIDLCRGPHLPHTGFLNKKSIKLKSLSSSYFLGNAQNDILQRIYGYSFPTVEELKQYRIFLEEAHKRDHRKIGQSQQLFLFDKISPGSCIFLPHGTRIYNKLIEFIKSEYHKRGFDEVKTPIIFKNSLWKQSGHLDKYKSNMFCFDINEDQQDKSDNENTYGLKPMNCPCHCKIFSSSVRSYKDLPIRYADFSVLHRNEAGGTLRGLTRVRSFRQDDAHIFCRSDQIYDELKDCVDFLDRVYTVFGFKYELELSTRPTDFIGDVNIWNNAEGYLKNILNGTNKNWRLNEGDGAFYGPKIDIHIKDALNRSYQCATIQLDFNLPERFDLTFVDKDNANKRPIIIHRAIYGSFERFFGILTEHYAGKWPFWLSPRQIIITPVHDDFIEYGVEIRNRLHDAGFYVDINKESKSIKAKIKSAQLAQYNYILIVGNNEMNNKTVNVRYRDNEDKKEISIDELINELNNLNKV